jgi:hypothetical protein
MVAQAYYFGALRTAVFTSFRRPCDLQRNRRALQFERVASSNHGVAVVHMFETLNRPPLFEGFLEGMTHVVEVVRLAKPFAS